MLRTLQASNLLCSSARRARLCEGSPGAFFPDGGRVNASTNVGVRRGSNIASIESEEKPLASKVYIPEDRLRQFVSAELSFLAMKEITPISLHQVLDAASPWQAAEQSIRELPIRFAHRIQQIEELPDWQDSKELQMVRELYVLSFRELRLVDPSAVRNSVQQQSTTRLAPFTTVVRDLKQRLRSVLPTLMSAMLAMREAEAKVGGMTEADINGWLDRFLLARIGTEMLTSQYLACITPGYCNSERSGIVHRSCDAAEICKRAASRVKLLCQQHYRSSRAGVANSVRIEVKKVKSVGTSDDQTGLHFTYVPQYLQYMVLELLKNSVRATVESSQKSREIQDKPITITISANSHELAIRIQDLAGGIPFEVSDQVWSYMYSTVPDNSEDFVHRGTPLAGYGVGLPLSRLYANFLGGSLHLMSMPGEGTSAFLYLKRIGEECNSE